MGSEKDEKTGLGAESGAPSIASDGRPEAEPAAEPTGHLDEGARPTAPDAERAPAAPSADERVALPAPAAEPTYPQADGGSDGSRDERSYAPNPQYRAQSVDSLSKYRTLTLIASAAGPISLFIGGTLLDIVGLTCGIIALVNLNRVARQQDDAGRYAANLRRMAIVAIVICGIAAALNIATVMAIMPELMSMMESGELGQLGAAPAPGTNSTWG